MSYWLLVTHSAALFPMGTLLWSWKERRELESLYMIIQFIYCVFFSLMYHAYDVEELSTEKNRNTWILLDSFFSSSLIITTIFYSLGVKSHYFYLFTSSSTILTLLITLLNASNYIIYLIAFEGLSVLVFKWRNLKRFILRFKFLLLFTIASIVTSIICYVIAVREYYNQTYISYHSSWHVFIFSAAGGGCLLRYKLDQMTIPIRNKPRELEIGDML